MTDPTPERRKTMRTDLSAAEKEMSTAERLNIWADDPGLPKIVRREMCKAARILDPDLAHDPQEQPTDGADDD